MTNDVEIAVPPSKEDLIKISEKMGVTMAPRQATESLFIAKKCSQTDANFDESLLVKWFCKNIPIMRPSGAGGCNFQLKKRSFDVHDQIRQPVSGLLDEMSDIDSRLVLNP